MDHLSDVQQGGSTLSLRPIAPDDRRYIHATWLEEFKYSCSKNANAPWAMFRAHIGPHVSKIIDSAQLLGAYADDGKIAGWLCYTPGQRVSTVHFAYTRFKIADVPACRRGLMSLLLDAAQLGSRLAYTHRGAMKKKHRGAERAFSVKPPSVDIPIAEWLRGKGVTAVFVDYQEWAR